METKHKNTKRIIVLAGNAMRKSLLVAFLTALMVCGFTLACTTHFCKVQASTSVSGIPKPSVPEFTMKYVDNSYDVPPTYGIDQYTGENVTVKEGYHVDNRMIKFTIKNQPFISYNDTSGNLIALYYNFRFKGHYGYEWSYYPFKPDGQSTIPYGMFTVGLSPKFPASNSDYTVVSINVSILDGLRDVPTGTQAEFQAQALIGHIDYIASGLLAGSYYNFTGERSDWSNTQTITIGESQTPTPSPAATPTPTPNQEPQQTEQTEITTIVGVVIVAVVLGAASGLLIYLIKRK